MKKILIIEDNQIVANVYRNKFLVEGYQTEVALDGESGLKLVHSFKPNMILLDLMLPKMSGVDVIRDVRGQEEFAKLPIVVFSNTYLTNLVQDAWKAGATKCLSKASCTPKQVIDAVRSTLTPKEESPRRPVTSIPQTPPAAPQLAPPSDADVRFQTELHSAFVITLPTVLAAL